MRVLIAPAGSRGDVQPLVALGVTLQRRGHDVLVCAAVNYRELIEDAGLPHADGGADVQKLLEDDGERFFSPRRFLGTVRELIPDAFAGLHAAAAAHRPGVVVGTMASVIGPSVAEAVGAKHVFAALQPSALPSREHPFLMLGKASLGPFNSLSWTLALALVRRAFGPALNAARVAHGLAPVGSIVTHLGDAGSILCAFDPELAPRPADWQRASDATGALFLEDDSDAQLPDDVEQFLAAGPRPVYIGFGSMPINDVVSRTRAVVDAINTAGVRALVSAGWGGLGAVKDVALPPGVKLIGPVSHGLLFPRVAGVAHHCGAGTTAAVCRAGVPHAPVPHAYDQPYWAKRMHALGVAAAPLPRSFRGEALAAALRRCLDDSALRQRAADLGARIRARDGNVAAARFVEGLVARAV